MTVEPAGDTSATRADAPDRQRSTGLDLHVAELRRLGDELHRRYSEVLEQVSARATRSGTVLVGDVVVQLDHVLRSSTVAVAGWIAGGDREHALDAGRAGWQIFGELTAERAAPLNEIIKRSVYWRDAVNGVLRDSAEQLSVEDGALGVAVTMVDRTFDLTVIEVCERFEVERQRTDDELAARQRELAFLATHDALTGLPNRTLLMDRAEQMLARSLRHKTRVAALFIDIDGFKDVNDTRGHGAGDELLRAVAARLSGVVRDADVLGRFGGDEFVVIAEGDEQDAAPEVLAQRLLQAVQTPFTLPSDPTQQATVSASIGIATGENRSADQLLRDADMAMYHAKRDGKNRYVVFDTEMLVSTRNPQRRASHARRREHARRPAALLARLAGFVGLLLVAAGLLAS